MNILSLFDGMSGGTISVTNQQLYADVELLKTASASGQKTTITGSGGEERYLPVRSYYLQFIGTGTGVFRLTYEERP